jgi:DnaK suppressor protein
MNHETLDQFRRNLVARRSALLQRWRQALEEEEELLADREIDWPDAAAAQTAAVVLDSISEHERHALARIQSSLARIDRGTYDKCAVCHGTIDEARLRAIPDTDRCVVCAPRLN